MRPWGLNGPLYKKHGLDWAVWPPGTACEDREAQYGLANQNNQNNIFYLINLIAEISLLILTSSLLYLTITVPPLCLRAGQPPKNDPNKKQKTFKNNNPPVSSNSQGSSSTQPPPPSTLDDGVPISYPHYFKVSKTNGLMVATVEDVEMSFTPAIIREKKDGSLILEK